MIITQEQMAHMRQIAIQAFHGRLRRHLVIEFPEGCAALGEDALTRNVVDSIARANSFGIETERGIVKFIETIYRLHFHLDRPDLGSWAHRILASMELDPAAKIDHVYATVRGAWQASRSAAGAHR